MIANDADRAAVDALALEYPAHTLLVASENIAAALRGVRGVERAILHTLADPAALPDLDGACPLAADASLASLPAALADELEAARRNDRAIWVAYVDGEPVSFAYAPWRSDRWFDVSVDTLATARQLGLATLAATAMIRDERGLGREPVWGADHRNVASLRLARRLGFAPVDEIWIASP